MVSRNPIQEMLLIYVNDEAAMDIAIQRLNAAGANPLPNNQRGPLPKHQEEGGNRLISRYLDPFLGTARL